MVRLFNEYFPNTPVYISLGNNDSYSGDYHIQQGGKFLNARQALHSRITFNRTHSSPHSTNSPIVLNDDQGRNNKPFHTLG